MNPHRSIALRWFATVVIIATWLLASNHCAIGLMQGARAAAEHVTCCNSPKTPSAPAKQAPAQECCKALQGMVPASAKIAVEPAATDFLLAVLVCWREALAPQDGMEARLLFETGPPLEAPTFTQLVLQRSLPALAPPAVA